LFAAARRQRSKQDSARLNFIDRSFPAIRAAREEAGPDIELTLDVNCPWTL